MGLVENSRRMFASEIFRLQEFVKGHRTFSVLREMQREQWISREALRDVQEHRLRLLLKSANSVPYYHELFHRADVNPDNCCVADMQRIPFLTKEIIRVNLGRMKALKTKGVRKFSTGGSTGSPLTFYLGPTRVSSDVAARIRAESWFGVAPGDSEFAIWGSPVEISKQDRIRELRDRILGTQLLSAFEMSPETMSRYIDEMEQRG